MTNNYDICIPKTHGTFDAQLAELEERLYRHLADEEAKGRHLIYSKVFLSDAQNQYSSLVGSKLYKGLLSTAATTAIEQPPACGSKIGVLTVCGNASHALFHSMRLSEEEAAGNDSYTQTSLLFQRYISEMEAKGLDMATHLVRTWIYVAGIDTNYAGVVKARNDIFRKHGMTADTHFVASTGIGGYTQTRSALVAIDFLTYPNIKEEDKKYLKALDHLNPTHEYGVAFERGTKLSLPDVASPIYYISGTASIDKRGKVVNEGDVTLQACRLLENIEALLNDGGASLDDIKYLIVYLRDLSDRDIVEEYMGKRFPAIPHITVQAKVCRPQWLIEMECVARG